MERRKVRERRHRLGRVGEEIEGRGKNEEKDQGEEIENGKE